MAQDLLTVTAAGYTFSLTLTFAGAATSGVVTNISGTALGESVSTPTQPTGDQIVSLTYPYVDGVGLEAVLGGVDYTLKTYSGGVEIVTSTGGVYPVTSMSLAINVCYVEGVRILTARGQVAVEDLRVGDLAVTADGALRPIRWIGRRRVDCRRHPNPADALPVRIAAHAFGPERPCRDLWVSPGHCLCVDVLGEALIRAGSLINGATVQQIDTDSVVYWHVELDSHDVLLAENLPAESYLDMGNRSFFVESGVVRLIETPDALLRTQAEFRHPLHEGGALVEAVRSQLLTRAQALGWSLEREPFNDLHLVVDGQRIDPERDGLSAHFDVPTGAQDIRLVCIASRPCDLPNETRDTRSLGVCLQHLQCGGQEIALDDPRLQRGFHDLETYSWGAFRWTDGDAALPASLFGDIAEARRLSVGMMRPPLPFWAAPVVADAAQAA